MKALLFAIVTILSLSSFAKTASGFCIKDGQSMFILNNSPTTVIATLVHSRSSEEIDTLVLQYFTSSTARLSVNRTQVLVKQESGIFLNDSSDLSYAKWAQAQVSADGKSIQSLSLALANGKVASFICK